VSAVPLEPVGKVISEEEPLAKAQRRKVVVRK